ncbi:MAG: FAD-binding and (Fe-S)-binding domain-containing protein [Gaiellales bacterium]
MATISPVRSTAAPRPSASLAADLRSCVQGEVRFDAGSRALYAHDGSVYRQVPTGVVIPRTVEDVVATVDACRGHDAAILARGCGTGLAGQTVNHAVVIDFSKYLNRVTELDADGRTARIQPGVICDQLRDAAEEHGLTFGPDPATHARCTLGGMIGNNSCGVHSIMAGVTADNIESLDMLLYDGTRLRLPSQVSEQELERVIASGGREGEIYSQLRDLRDRYADLIRERFPDIPRRISGFNLDRLLPEHGFNVAAAVVGTESTIGGVLEATSNLNPRPHERSLVLLGYPDPFIAAEQVGSIMEFGPIGLETFDQRLVSNELEKGFQRHTELLPEGEAWLLVEFGADSKQDADEQAESMLSAFRKKKGPQVGMKLYEDAGEEAQVWQIREGGVGHSKVPGRHPGWPSWEDAAVHPDHLGPYLREFEQLVGDHGLRVSAYFGHVGHGCLHTRLDYDFSTAEGVRNFRRFQEAAADLVCRYGGSLSGEHGDGHARAELLPKMFGEELVWAFREFKAVWDPGFRMNPGKVVDPYRMDQHLKTGPSYRPREVRTHFRFPDDGGSFAAAAERCFGVGACRELEGGTMCPSFQATREERHSTRGRARLLFEMMHATQLRDGWRSDEVKEALDLCLACKGCKHDCPVRVDMATYKAEFLSHYWKRRLRPLRAYALGMIAWEARLASRSPWLANALAGSGKRLLGLAPQRDLPEFAPITFGRWFRDHTPAHPHGEPVLLWPDTFNDHFHPETAIAAVDVLEHLGFRVEVPGSWLCCGRPLYDFGMLTLAKRHLRRILDTLQPQIEAGIPVVALEPSCGSVLRDELVNLFPHDNDARRLSKQTFLLAEFIQQRAAGAPLPALAGRAVVHGHCHHTALWRMDDEMAVLDRMGVDAELLDSGCCGLAGSFGYEAGEHYDVSMKAGERVLLPAVRDASRDTLVISDGFSCRTQIGHATDRRAMHLAEVIQLALRQDSTGGAPQEAEAAPAAANGSNGHRMAAVAGAAGVAGMALVAGGVLARTLRH